MKIAHHESTLTLIDLLLKNIDYEICITNLSQIVIMRVSCSYKVLVFILVAFLLLIDFTNSAKAANYADKAYSYDSYQYPDYQYPDLNSTYVFFLHLYRSILLPVLLRSSRSIDRPLLLGEFSGFERSARFKSLFFLSCQCVKMNPNVKIQLFYWLTFRFGFIFTHCTDMTRKREAFKPGTFSLEQNYRFYLVKRQLRGGRWSKFADFETT